MTDDGDIMGVAPYSLDRTAKDTLLTRTLTKLTASHVERCPEYRRILDCLGFDLAKTTHYDQLPFLPVSLFKNLELRSVPPGDVIKTMTSSGTSGQPVSRIFLDRKTAANQQKALAKIVGAFLGRSRLPMLIIDSPSVLLDRALLSARGAGILGFSLFATDRAYGLDDTMNLDVAAVEGFLEKHRGERILLFGFTFMVWKHFYGELAKLNHRLDFSNAILIHGGGWKKLLAESVEPELFKRRLRDVCGLAEVHDYYGMVEQTGCISMECGEGRLHASIFSDIIPRRATDLQPCEFGEIGILQSVSTLPESYPGHSLLTEDEGVLLGVDDCPCGRKGKYFKVLGRLKDAEIRGCSDTYAARF